MLNIILYIWHLTNWSSEVVTNIIVYIGHLTNWASKVVTTLTFDHRRTSYIWPLSAKTAMCDKDMYLSNKNRIFSKVMTNNSLYVHWTLNHLSYNLCNRMIIDYPHYIWLWKDKLHITIIYWLHLSPYPSLYLSDCFWALREMLQTDRQTDLECKYCGRW